MIMAKTRCTFVLLLPILYQIYIVEACLNQYYTNSLDDHIIHAKNLSFDDCSQISFEGNQKLNSQLGSVGVALDIEQKKEFSLNISFCDIKWKKAYVKISEQNKPETSICQEYTIADKVKFPITEINDVCFNLETYNRSVDYVLEFKAELSTDILFKQLVFRLPPSVESFENSLPLSKRNIFTSVDASSNHEITLKIQTLPSSYNITYYKVEVFRKKDSHESDNLLDIRMLKPGTCNEVGLEYVTYNEEGYYFFKVSAVSDVCPEDTCPKTLSSEVYIKRKYPPLVIGIVGASFLIPFVLFILHMWNRRSQWAEMESHTDKLFLVYNQTPEKHYIVVKSLEKSLKSLTNVQIVTKIAEATQIIYICGTHIFEPDPATHKFLVNEATKVISDLDILVVSFPYSTKDVPNYLKKFEFFDLMKDFGKLVHVFNCDAEYENNLQYQDLKKKVEAAQIQTEPTKITLNMPIIIVTEQSDSSDTEPKEADVLL